MERYAGRVALVTGASCGIGAAIAKALLRHGLTVVGLDLQPEKMKEWEQMDTPGKLHAVHGDISKEESILTAFRWITDNLGGVDILINNAGVCFNTSLISARTAEWRHMLDVNVLGLSICTREAVQDMLRRGVDDGFVIHICSIAAHVEIFDPAYSMYFATKVAVKALLQGLRKDLILKNSNIRVGEVCPSLVKTELYKGLTDVPSQLWEEPHLQPENIADVVIYMLSRDPRVQVHDVIVFPTRSRF